MEEHAFVGLLDEGCDVGGPGDVLRDVSPRNLKLVTRSTSSSLIWTAGCVPFLFLLDDDLFGR